MRCITATIIAFAIPKSVLAFVTQKPAIAERLLHQASKDSNENVIDIDHAKYCADHFGECSLEEMERIRNALHQERLTHLITDTDGIRNPHGLKEDLAHKLLESELTLQMGLLNDKLATEHMQEDSLTAYGANPYSSTMRMPVLDGTLDEESSETLMICLAIAALALLPQFL